MGRSLIITRWRLSSLLDQCCHHRQELLLISNVSVDDEGSYSCLVKSPLDSATQEWQVLPSPSTSRITITITIIWCHQLCSHKTLHTKVSVVDPPFIIHFTDFRLVLDGEKVVFFLEFDFKSHADFLSGWYLIFPNLFINFDFLIWIRLSCRARHRESPSLMFDGSKRMELRWQRWWWCWG